MVGDDAIFTRARWDGADGGVSGVGCAIPELMLGLNAAIVSGDGEKRSGSMPCCRSSSNGYGDFPRLSPLKKRWPREACR